MPYTPQQWKDGVTTAPYGPTDAARFTYMEAGIVSASLSIFNVKDYGAKGDGATDDIVAILATIDAASLVGGIVFFPPGVYAISATLILKSGLTGFNSYTPPIVSVVLPRGAELKWIGAAGGTMISNGTVNPWIRGSFGGGGKLNANSLADKVFDLHSPQMCTVGDFWVVGGTATTTVMNVDTNVSAVSGSLRNACFNRIGGFMALGDIGIGLRLTGSAAGGVVTENTFFDIRAADVHDKFITIVEWTDTNVFDGQFFCNLAANDAQGLVINDTGNAVFDVYSNVFDTLVIDSNGLLTGRKGVVLNPSKRILINFLSADHPPEGGAVVDNGCSSYLINGGSTSETTGVSNGMPTYAKGRTLIEPTAETYGIALPTNPYNGQVFTLVDSVSAPTYQWTLRYNAGSASAYKWESIGGTEAVSQVATSETTASTTNADLTTVQALAALAYGGDYDVEFGCELLSSTINSNVFTAVTISGVEKASVYSYIASATRPEDVSRKLTLTSLSAGDVLKQQFRVESGTGAFFSRFMRVTPRRVG